MQTVFVNYLMSLDIKWVPKTLPTTCSSWTCQNGSCYNWPTVEPLCNTSECNCASSRTWKCHQFHYYEQLYEILVSQPPPDLKVWAIWIWKWNAAGQSGRCNRPKVKSCILHKEYMTCDNVTGMCAMQSDKKVDE
jgi:hypothetical protein